MTVVWDIDGTLCDGRHRGIYDPKNRSLDEDILKDKIVPELKELLFLLFDSSVYTIILTAREKGDIPVTLKWLDKNKVVYNELIMNIENKNPILFKELEMRKIRRVREGNIIAIEDNEEIIAKFREIGVYTLGAKLV